jgi:cell division septation protein DedD
VARDSTGYLKVRVGPYLSRDAAQRALAQLKARLGGQPFVVEEP